MWIEYLRGMGVELSLFNGKAIVKWPVDLATAGRLADFQANHEAITRILSAEG